MVYSLFTVVIGHCSVLGSYHARQCRNEWSFAMRMIYGVCINLKILAAAGATDGLGEDCFPKSDSRKTTTYRGGCWEPRCSKGVRTQRGWHVSAGHDRLVSGGQLGAQAVDTGRWASPTSGRGWARLPDVPYLYPQRLSQRRWDAKLRPGRDKHAL